MLDSICLTIITMATIGFFRHRGFHYLVCFRHKKYNRTLFKNWLFDNWVFDRKGSSIALIAAAASKDIASRTMSVGIHISIVATIAMAALCFFEPDPRKIATIDNQICAYMKNIYRLAIILYSLLVICVILGPYALGLRVQLFWHWLAVIVLIQSSPIWLVLANHILLKLRR